MRIHLSDLDLDTQKKYREFETQVKDLLRKYQEEYEEEYKLIQQKIELTNKNWDTSIDLLDSDLELTVNISQLLAFEYCMATKRITHDKVSFEQMADRLFSGVQKFRIGNPVKGMDDECLYEKSFDDETAIPVTSKLYRIVMNAGAQHLEYFKDGEMTGAVFIYEKGKIEGIAIDDNGNSVDIKTDGINFSDLRNGQSLLNNLRQTAFHEWNHCAEKERLDSVADFIPYEYNCEDGKVYRNYDRLTQFVTYQNGSTYNEPTYIISDEKDENGNNKKYYINKDGEKRPLKEVKFDLLKGQLDTPICFSSGLTTKEPNGTIHNMITEGFVEYSARMMMKAIEPDSLDIDEGKYFEQVEMAKEVISARDISLGEEENGQTFADFLMHSSRLKKDLESRNVQREDGTLTDGLHYIADYADKAKAGKTERWKFISSQNMNYICSHLGVIDAQKRLESLGITEIRKLSSEQKQQLVEILMSGTNPDSVFVHKIVEEYIDILQREDAFFEGISGKLGYVEKTKLQSIEEKEEESKEKIGNIPRRSEFTVDNEENLLRQAYESKFIKGLLNEKENKASCIVNLYYGIGMEDFFIYDEASHEKDSKESIKKHLMIRALHSAMLQTFLKDATTEVPFEKCSPIFREQMEGLDVQEVIRFHESPMNLTETKTLYHGTPNKDIKVEQLGHPNEEGIYANKDGVAYWTTDYEYASNYKEHGAGNGIVLSREVTEGDVCQTIPRTDGGACFMWQEELKKMSKHGVKYLFSSDPNEHDVLDIENFADFVEKRDRCVTETLQKYGLRLPQKGDTLFRLS